MPRSRNPLSKFTICFEGNLSTANVEEGDIINIKSEIDFNPQPFLELADIFEDLEKDKDLKEELEKDKKLKEELDVYQVSFLIELDPL